MLSSNNSRYNGGLSNDQLFGTSGSNLLIGGAGSDELRGRDGNDTLNGKSAESTAERDPVIDCGAGTLDHAIIDLQDADTVGCEDTDRSAIGEEPHVKPVLTRRLLRVRRGSVRVRLRCPRKTSHGCAGTLALRLGAASTAQTGYALDAGEKRRVRVDLGALRALVDERTVAQLISLEPGRIRGDKTTLRRIVLSRLAAQRPCPTVPASGARSSSC